MLKLYGQSVVSWDGDPFVARLTTDCNRPLAVREQEVLLLANEADCYPEGFRAYVTARERLGNTLAYRPRVLPLPALMGYLTDGDVVHIAPRSGQIHVLYRRHSTANTIFVTGRCNCRCIMCPQPPKPTGEEEHWAPMWLAAIPLMAQDTLELGISGGEPTLVPDDLLEILAACRGHLPHTAVQVLSNGRMFNYMSLCRNITCINHPDLMFGIPIYSDLPYVHDYIVQAENAFDQTVRGIMNLRRYGQRVEVRVVLLRQNVERLPDIAYFIARNLPFVEHVALMGLEPMGYAAASWHDIWVDPADYQAPLEAAVECLTAHRIPVSIYNHQLCVLNRSLWPLAKKSISDWKNEYLGTCQTCGVRANCGGFFASARRRHSKAIHVI